MVNTPVAPSPSVSVDLPEKRVQFYNISWQAYEAILAAIGDRRSALLSYYKGTLEIMTPLEKHENSSDSIDHFIQVLTEEGDLNIKSMGSTTLNRADLKVGAEPDKGYYIANEPLVRGKIVDLNTDPPPDLIVEVDITHTDINKNALYAEMGVPEFWRYNGEILIIYWLRDGVYEVVEVSPTFPWVTKERLYEFLQDCAQIGEKQAKRDFRDWIKQQLASQDS
jgi:Uma2 family endonuclease